MKSRPDIYHIMLDAYSRADILKDIYGFDNSGFIQALRQRGFNIGGESYSNYSTTALSLTSTLNFNYFDSHFVDLSHTSPNWKRLESLKNNAKVPQFLLSNGYKWKVIPNGWENTFPLKADIIKAPEGIFSNVILNEFQNGVLNMTPIPHLLATAGYNDLSIQSQHRNRILFAFNYLMEAPLEPGPKYVFCHILAPHSPIAFGANGELREDIPDLNILRKTDPRLFRLSVTDEITYLNQRLLAIVDKIIKDSKGQAVILIHSDHGESVMDFSNELDFLHQRHGILAALYLPGGAQEKQFTGAVSPVNFFRIIFNHLFNTGLPLLDARTFFSNRTNPFDLRDITDTLNIQMLNAHR